MPRKHKDQTNRFHAVCIDETEKWAMINKLFPSFPDPNSELMDGVVWGNPNILFTPAFWKIQYHLTNFSDDKRSHKLGASILEEVVACLLGGYGLRAEIGLMAFHRLKQRRLIKKMADHKSVLIALKEPFKLQSGRCVRYRFFTQKSRYISQFLNRDDLDKIPVENDLVLREWLLTIKGIGPKTASWITRNWLKSQRVAILDVHLIRAGVIAGIFQKNIDVSKSYLHNEERFLNFCTALEVKPSNMDALIWWWMKQSNRIALNYLND